MRCSSPMRASQASHQTGGIGNITCSTTCTPTLRGTTTITAPTLSLSPTLLYPGTSALSPPSLCNKRVWLQTPKVPAHAQPAGLLLVDQVGLEHSHWGASRARTLTLGGGRHWLQQYVTPLLNPLILSFGLFGNYIFHTGELLGGREKFSAMKLALPLQLVLLCLRWGWWGVALMYAAGGNLAMCYLAVPLTHVCAGTLGVYYFTMALMNHNTEHCMHIDARNTARDWGEAQLHSSAGRQAVCMPMWCRVVV